MDNSIGKRIKDLRESKQWTQLMIAERMNVAQSLVAKLETGNRNLTVDEAVQLAGLFGVSTDYLLGLSGDVKSPDMETREICERLGLTEAAIGVLDGSATNYPGFYREVINLLLGCEKGQEGLRQLSYYFYSRYEDFRTNSYMQPVFKFENENLSGYFMTDEFNKENVMLEKVWLDYAVNSFKAVFAEVYKKRVKREGAKAVKESGV